MPTLENQIKYSHRTNNWTSYQIPMITLNQKEDISLTVRNGLIINCLLLYVGQEF